MTERYYYYHRNDAMRIVDSASNTEICRVEDWPTARLICDALNDHAAKAKPIRLPAFFTPAKAT